MRIVLLAVLLATALAQDPKPAPSPTPAPPPPPPKRVLPPPASDALAQCQSSCSRGYYFCLQENDAELCAPAWNTCRADCVRTSRPGP